MAQWLFLDAGPLGLVHGDEANPEVAAFLNWFEARSRPNRFCVATVTDYEVRRELIRLGAKARIRKLDDFLSRVRRVPVSNPAWQRAGRFWAEVRRRGVPTGDDRDLDGDALLAGVAATFGAPADSTMIGTDNLRHYRRSRGVEARRWRDLSA